MTEEHIRRQCTFNANYRYTVQDAHNADFPPLYVQRCGLCQAVVVTSLFDQHVNWHVGVEMRSDQNAGRLRHNIIEAGITASGNSSREEGFVAAARLMLGAAIERVRKGLPEDALETLQNMMKEL